MRFFSPVVKHTSIRMLLIIVVQFDLELEQMDIKTTFLHDELEENIYMKQPESYIQEVIENKVRLLKKSLYGDYNHGAMMESLNINQTWTLVDLLKDSKAIGCR